MLGKILKRNSAEVRKSTRRAMLLGVMCIAIAGCASSARDSARKPFLEKVKVSSFSVNAPKAYLLGEAKKMGAQVFSRRLETALNEQLSGIGSGQNEVQLNVKLDFAYIYKRAPDSIIGTSVSGSTSDYSVGVSGKLTSTVGSSFLSKVSAEEAIERSINDYVKRMRKLLEES